jgi:hypothetical protein
MTTTLPPIANVQVATVPLAAFLAREAAILAAAGTSSPLPEINFLNATVKIGDGAASGAAPQQPSISTLQASGALVHQVWSGLAVQSCSQNATNANQVDILCVIPAVDSSGVEIGPFWATEFIVTDETGTAMIAGVTLAPKLVTANGAATDLAFIVSVGFSVGTVVLTAPSAPWMTAAQIQAGIANEVTGTAPIAVAKTVDSAGWPHFAVSIDPASIIHNGVDTSAAGNVVTVAALTPAETALTPGQLLVITKGAAANTGAAAATVMGSSGAVIWADGSALAAGGWPGGVPALVKWDGTTFLILSVMGPSVFSLATAGKHFATFSAVGTTNFTAPITGWYWSECYGPGGGAGVYTVSPEGEGGGGGGYSGKWIFLTAGTVVPVTIGAGGTTSGTGSGTAGGTTSFGSYHSATGGGPGTVGGSNGAGGVGIGGDINLTGQSGVSGNQTFGVQNGQGGDCAGPFGGKGGLGADSSGPTWPGGGGNVTCTTAGASPVGAAGMWGGVIIRY